MSRLFLSAVALLLAKHALGFGSLKNAAITASPRGSHSSYSKFRLWNDAPFQSKVNGDSIDVLKSANGDVKKPSLTPSYQDLTDEMPDVSTEQLRKTNEQLAMPPSFPLVLWRFTRPHTLIGSAIAIPSIFLLASPTYASFFTKQSLGALMYAAVPSLLMNLYITGLNQITDVEIDKINKPELVIAKGDLKKSTAIGVVCTALAISLAMSVVHPVFSTPGLQLALWGSFILGTMYSLPPFRMKRHPLLAAFCIVAVRGTIINAGFYSHALTAAFGAAGTSAVNMAGTGVLQCLMHDWKCWSSSLFFGIFGIVIALMKDVPDAVGDRIFNIRSFTVRVGQKRVFGMMKNLLTLLFGVVGVALVQRATVASTVVDSVRRGIVGIGSLIAAWSTGYEAQGVNAEDSGEVYNYYMHLWKLFYMSYFALPFVK
jgi:homogentisate phytyltransferase/homogentisate geranylgeranyltransferase